MSHRLYFIRHGQATGGWDQDPDPGLSDLGRQQAEKAAERLKSLGPLPIVSSPMRRAQETAEAFVRLWGGAPRIEARVSEIPSPTEDLQARREWLSEVMAGGWSDDVAQKAGPHDLRKWHQDVLQALKELKEDTVITSHFIAINAAVGALTGDDRVVCFHPDNASITIIENDGGKLRLIEKGHEAETEVR